MSQIYTIHTLTEALGCNQKKVYNTVRQHKEQFVEYQDYMRIFGPAVKEYKDQGIIPRNSKGIVTVWSEEGLQKLKKIMFSSRQQRKAADPTEVFANVAKTFERTVNVIVEQGRALVQEKDKRIALLEHIIKDTKEQVTDLRKDKETYRSVTAQLSAR